MLAVLVARGANLLVLDEPINHLDVPSREKFEEALAAFQGSVLAVVHDRYFVTSSPPPSGPSKTARAGRVAGPRAAAGVIARI